MTELPPLIVPREIVLEPLDSLVPHPANARQSNVGEIIESVRANGVFRALRCQVSSRRILAGHGEAEALRQLGYEQVPVEWLDVDDGHALDILIADNGTSDEASYDAAAQAALLTDLAATRDQGIVGLGWSQERYDALLDTLAPYAPLPESPPKAPDAPGEPKRKCPQCGYSW
jgi:ParB-like chromosome segregation protein Spo0J